MRALSTTLAVALVAAMAGDSMAQSRSGRLRRTGDRVMQEHVFPKQGIKGNHRGRGYRPDSPNHRYKGGRDWKLRTYGKKRMNRVGRAYVNEMARRGLPARAIVETYLPRNPKGPYIQHRSYRDDRRYKTGKLKGKLKPNTYRYPRPKKNWGPHVHTDFDPVFKKRSGLRWKCNAFGATHKKPSDCSKPEKGGTWVAK